MACISLYGDSLTYSEEVDDKDAWGNILASSLGCKVNNFGVGGYGVDQSILRFEQNGISVTDLTILGLHIDNINRNVNQWRYLITGLNRFSFKPTFWISDSGELMLQRMPIDSCDAMLGAIEVPGNVLRTEWYLPDTNARGSTTRVSFPYSRTLFRVGRKTISEIDWDRVLSFPPNAGMDLSHATEGAGPAALPDSLSL